MSLIGLVWDRQPKVELCSSKIDALWETCCARWSTCDETNTMKAPFYFVSHEMNRKRAKEWERPITCSIFSHLNTFQLLFNLNRDILSFSLTSHDFDFFQISRKVKDMTLTFLYFSKKSSHDLSWLFLKKMTFGASLAWRTLNMSGARRQSDFIRDKLLFKEVYFCALVFDLTLEMIFYLNKCNSI